MDTKKSEENKHSFDKIEETLNTKKEGLVELIAPESEPLLQFFTWAHLPEKLQAFSKPFGELAHKLCDVLPRNPERTVMLRKLLESKDCAVRAFIYKDPK